MAHFPPGSSGDSRDVVAQAQESVAGFLATEVRSAVLYSGFQNILKCPKDALTEDSCREMDEIMSASPRSVPRVSAEMVEEAKGWNEERNVSFHLGLLYLRQSSQPRCFW